MQRRKRNVIGLFVIGLILVAIQGALWVHTISSARTETDKQNIEQRRSPTEIPAVAGSLLIVVAAVVASIPERATHKSHT